MLGRVDGVLYRTSMTPSATSCRTMKPEMNVGLGSSAASTARSRRETHSLSTSFVPKRSSAGGMSSRRPVASRVRYTPWIVFETFGVLMCV